MTILQNFPLISQQTPISADGSSPNAEMDCVPTSILAAIMYLKGITALSVEWNPDKLLDMAYPEGYKGGTSAKAFVQACADLGIHLYPFNGNPGQLIQHIHEQLALNHPCIVTVPDIYVPASYGWTHVLCMFADSPGRLTALDPWPGKPITKSDAEWMQLLLNNEIWVAEKLEDTMKIDINSPLIANYFTEQSPGWWLCKQTGKIIHGEILGFYQNIGGLLDLGLPVSNEIPLDQKGNTKQHFERGVLFFDPGHVYDNPPGSGRVYKAHLYSGQGQDPQIAILEAQAKGVDPAKVANFQQAASLQVHDLVQKAQAIESSLIVPLA